MSLLNVRTRMPKPAAALSGVLWSLGCISLGVHKKEAIWVQFPYGQKISRGLNTGVVTTLMTFDSNQSPPRLSLGKGHAGKSKFQLCRLLGRILKPLSRLIALLRRSTTKPYRQRRASWRCGIFHQDNRSLGFNTR